MSDSDGNKTLGLRGSGSRPGNVKQSFSHGRTKNVVVETKRKRVVVPKPGAGKGVRPKKRHAKRPRKKSVNVRKKQKPPKSALLPTKLPLLRPKRTQAPRLLRALHPVAVRRNLRWALARQSASAKSVVVVPRAVTTVDAVLVN